MSTTELANEEFVSITTFKRDGTPVSTPVWVASENGSLLVISQADTWKVKRIRRDHHVRIGPCSARGALRGEPIDADAASLQPRHPNHVGAGTEHDQRRAELVGHVDNAFPGRPCKTGIVQYLSNLCIVIS